MQAWWSSAWLIALLKRLWLVQEVVFFEENVDPYTFYCSEILWGKSVTYTFFILIQETMENVKKCKSFLSTLIKLASSGKQSTETAANVKDLVQNLLVRNSHKTVLRIVLCDLSHVESVKACVRIFRGRGALLPGCVDCLACVFWGLG